MSDPDTAPAGVVSDDLSCFRCGHNLRSARLDGVCPECGAGVEASVSSLDLTRCQPAWLSTLVAGFTLLIIGFTGSIIVNGVRTVLVFEPRVWSAATRWSILAMVGAFGLVRLTATWRLTVPRPEGDINRRWTVIRPFARFGMLGEQVLVVLAMVPPGELTPPLNLAFVLVYLVGLAALLEQVRIVAERLAAPRLTLQVRIVQIALVLLSAWFLLERNVVLGSLTNVMGSLRLLLGSARIWAPMLSIGCLVWLVVLLLMLRTRLRHALRERAV